MPKMYWQWKTHRRVFTKRGKAQIKISVGCFL